MHAIRFNHFWVNKRRSRMENGNNNAFVGLVGQMMCTPAKTTELLAHSAE
jgi:hypothetical protein